MVVWLPHVWARRIALLLHAFGSIHPKDASTASCFYQRQGTQLQPPDTPGLACDQLTESRCTGHAVIARAPHDLQSAVLFKGLFSRQAAPRKAEQRATCGTTLKHLPTQSAATSADHREPPLCGHLLVIAVVYA